MKKKIRTLAISLLNDDEGICDEGYQALASLLYETDNQDILDAVECNHSRYYISNEDAGILKK